MALLRGNQGRREVAPQGLNQVTLSRTLNSALLHLLLTVLVLPSSCCFEEASTLRSSNTPEESTSSTAAFGTQMSTQVLEGQPGSSTQTLRWMFIVTGRVERLATDVGGTGLGLIDLTRTAPLRDAPSTSNLEQRLPPGLLGAAQADAVNASLECHVSTCPALSRCSVPGIPGVDAGIEWCQSAGMVRLTAPNRRPNRMLMRQKGEIPHMWLHSLEFNALDICSTVTVGKGIAVGPPPTIVRPQCHVFEQERTQSDLGLLEPPLDPSGQVFVLEDVFLDSWGRVFNSTHQFHAGGCAKPNEFVYSRNMAIVHVEYAVNAIAAFGSEGTQQLPLNRGISRLHAMAFELPLALLVDRLFSLPRGTILATHHSKFMHVVLSQLSSQVFRDRATALRTSAPKPGSLWLVKRLIQPAFQPCGKPGLALWESSRRQHILYRDLADGLRRAKHSRHKPLPLVPPSAPLILPGWRIVVHMQALASVQSHPSLSSLINRFFPEERMTIYSRGYSVKEDQFLFGHSPLFITTTATPSALSRIVFMPPHSTVLLLQNCTEQPSDEGSQVTTITTDLAVPLAAACQVRLYIVRCTPQEGTTGGGSTEGEQAEFDSDSIVEVLDRVAMDVYTVTDPLPAEPAAKRQLAAYQEWSDCISREGRWVYNPTPRRLPWPHLSTSDSEGICDTRHMGTGGIVGEEADNVAGTQGLDSEWRVREAVKYEWEVPAGTCPVSPHAPPHTDNPLAPFSPTEFCSRVGRGKSIVFLGDSMTQQMVGSFINLMLLGAPEPVEAQVTVTIPRRCRVWLPVGTEAKRAFCGKYRFSDSVCPGLKVYFVRNDYLTLHNPRSEDRVQFSRLRFVSSADIIVLNRGAHFEEDKKYTRDLTAVLHYFRNRFPEASVIFRNSPPGHVGCQNISKPLTTRQNPEILPIAYGWARFREQNEIARKLVQEHDYVYMDVETMTSLRGDGHKGIKPWDGTEDCLHYCMPGPIDTWNRLLYNTLLWVAPLQ